MLLKFRSSFRIIRSTVFENNPFSRRYYCATTFSIVNPAEIGKLSLNVKDKRISNLLGRFRFQYDAAVTKEIKLSDDQLDFLQRVVTMESQIKEINHQIEELKRNFPECSPDSKGENGVLDMEKTDTELAKLVEEDYEGMIKGRRRLENILLSELAVWLLSGRNENDNDTPRDLIMEVSAGVGGQEAMLFTKEIFDMYRRYAARQNWKFDILEERTTDLNGLHFAAVAITGDDAYAKLRFEGGVHRVQRVPATETSGRVHTSTMSVAILAQPPNNNEMKKINMKEFKFEVFKACAPGGQNLNKSETGSRITHLPTGVVVKCQMERYTDLNRNWALKRILAILYEKKTDAQRNSTQQCRKLQVGSLARSEKIRTYNYQQDRITDHRTKHSFVGIPETLDGGEGLDRIVQSMLRFHIEERLSEALDEEERNSGNERNVDKCQVN